MTDIRKILPVLAIVPGLAACNSSQPQKDVPPNIVLVFLDDAGWGDFEPFCETRYPTPNVRKLAEAGTVFQNFYVPQAICSASRSALLTGCYPERTGVVGAHGPRQKGLDPSYNTLAELLQQAGYATGFFGKWHIGDQPDTRPPARGFDESAGIMYSNDMWAGHPQNPDYWGQWPLQYWENGVVTIDSVTAAHQPWFTTWFTDKAVDFIGRHHDVPFFLYLPHPQPHVPLFVSDKFSGKSGTGLYGDVIMEIDWSVGQILDALRSHGIDKNTMVIFSSDNGPWLVYGNHAGKTPFYAEKGTSFDGGVRSPLIISYPDQIEGGKVSHDAFCSIDLLPTICRLTGAPMPAYEIDGKDVWDLIRGEGETGNPHDYYAFTTVHHFEAVMSGDGKWKLHLPHGYRFAESGGKDGIPGRYIQRSTGYALYDMVHDPYEKLNVIDQYPDIAEELIRLASVHRQKFFPE